MSEIADKEILNPKVETKLAFCNYHQALQFINSVSEREITHEIIWEIHSRCMRGLLSESAVGRYRTLNVGISRSSKTPPPWERVGELMDKFLGDLNTRFKKCGRSLNDLPGVIETIAFAHYVFERIHPFEDGNGRVGRLLCDLIAKRFEIRPIIIWPSDRQRYVNAFEAVNRSGNLVHLTLFLAEQFLKRYPEKEGGQNNKNIKNIRRVLEEIIETQREAIKNQSEPMSETNIWEGFAHPCFE